MRYPYHFWSSALDDKMCDKIICQAMESKAQAAQLFSSSDSLSSWRSSTVRWLSASWIADLLLPYAKQANENFDIAFDGQIEMQFTEYHAADKGHYDWHHDVNWHGQTGQDRKLSLTLQLSDSADYEGGDFEFEEVTSETDFRPKGSILVFPSYLRHRVTTVTHGTRYALVAWYSGPQWR